MIKQLGAEMLTRDTWIQKTEIIALGTKLKEKYWEEYKKFIINLIKPDLDVAEWDLTLKK